MKSGNKNRISVFYPIDKNNAKEIEKQTGTKRYKDLMDYQDNEASFQNVMKGFDWLVSYTKNEQNDSEPKIPENKHRSTYFFQFQKHIKVKAIQYADLAEDFASGREPLIPIMYSHGLLGSAVGYNLTGLELASNGYIVFFIEHLDGSCSYTELSDGSCGVIDTNLKMLLKKYIDQND